jgi:multidrug efflux system membrane fusion protein
MRRIVSLAAAALAAAAIILIPRIGGEPLVLAAAEAPTPPPAPPPGVPITAGTVTVADVPIFVNAIGSVQAYNMVTIKSRVDGQIVELAFTEGQEVPAGTPLLKIDPRPYQAALEQAMAAKEKDEATVVSAKADLERSAALIAPGYRAVQTYDQQKATVAQLQAAIKGDEALINTARLNLSFTDIRAPIEGRLGARLVDVGNMVRATDAAGLVTITQVRPIFVTFTVPQDNLERIREEQAKGQLVVRAFGGDNKRQLADGKLTLIDNTIDQATGTIRLKATFANTDERLWPGAFVNVRVILSTRQGVPTVPAQTVQDGPAGQYAYVIKADNTVERRPVEVASVQDGVAAVTKGLAPGEKVVVEGQYRLTQGARVNIRPSPGTAG